MKNNIIRFLSVLTLAVLAIYLFPRYNNTLRYHVEMGRPWGYETVTADFDFPIYKTEAQLKEDSLLLMSDFAPCFRRTVKSNYNILRYEDYAHVEKEGFTRISVLDGQVSTIYRLSSVMTPKMAYEQLGKDMEPTLEYDTLATRKVRESLLSSISLTEGMVQSGENVIERGKIVNAKDYQKIQSLRMAYENRKLSLRQRILNTVGDTVLVCIFLLMFALYLFVFRPSLLDTNNNIFFFCLLPAIIITMICLEQRFTQLSFYLVPFAWVPILTRIFFDSRTALFLHLTTVFICSLSVTEPFEFLVVETAVGMVAVASLKDLTHRAQLTQTAGYILLTYIAVYTGFRLATMGDWHAIKPWEYFNFVVNAALIICSYGLVYLFERVFKLLSSVTLVELMDINSNLMHDFAERAPGSFQHSLQVSNLATEAAKQIGANNLLVRTGAMYHDIGKLQNPEYFVENQQDGQNPILLLSPKEAAAVIIRHVTDGAEIARKNNLPEVISHFILTHHGTSLARYFYNTAVNNGENPDPADYQYPGPKPTTKEDAILMMADAVEARSRSLAEYTEQSISEMVNDMIDKQIADGQFSDSPISFHDVSIIKDVFIQRLITINHHRIKYPTIQQENGK